MKWADFIKITGSLPIIDVEILLAGETNTSQARVQISRWHKEGKLIQLKRGLYLLSEAYRKIEIWEPYIASFLKKPSYISLEKALEYYDLIPEAVTVYTSVSTKRQGRFVSKAGIFDYRHIKNSLFWGYESITIHKQTAFMALPEKALLDLIYLNGLNIQQEYLEELRLQNVEKINIDRLFEYAEKFQGPGMQRAAKVIKKYISEYKETEKTL